MTLTPVFATPRPPSWIRWPLLIALLYFPVCGLRELPFGGGGRYLSVLAGPLALLLLITYDRARWRESLREALRFAKPFAPFLLACGLVFLVHPGATIDDPFSRVFWGAVLAAAAARLHPPRSAIYSAAALGSMFYLAVATRDIIVLGADRAGVGLNAIVFAQTAMLTAGLAIVGAFTERSQHWGCRVAWLAAGSASVIAVALSGSRGPLLAVAVLIALLAWEAWRRGHRVPVVASVSAAIAAGAAAMVWTPLGPRFQLGWIEAQNYFQAADPTLTSVGIRLELWRIALERSLDHPVLGYGYSSVADLAQQVRELHFLPAQWLADFQHFHSDWAHALMAGGFVLLIGLSVTIIALARQAESDLARWWLLLAMLAFGLTDLAFFRKPGFSLFIGAWALLSVLPRNTSDASQARSIPR